MSIKIPNGVKDSMPVEMFKGSPAATALLGTWAFSIIMFIVGLIGINNPTYIANPSYVESLGEVWVESCGSNGVPHETECDWYDANQSTIVDPAHMHKSLYIYGGVATALYASSWAYRKYKKLK